MNVVAAGAAIPNCCLNYKLAEVLDAADDLRHSAEKRVTDRTNRLRGSPGIGKPAQRGAWLSGIRWSGCDCLNRLYGPREFRDEYPGRGEVPVWTTLGGVARQSDRDAVPGPLRETRHCHWTEPGGDVPRAVSPAGCLGDVGDQRGCRDGDRSGRISRRCHRAFLVVPNAPPRRDGRHGGCNL